MTPKRQLLAGQTAHLRARLREEQSSFLWFCLCGLWVYSLASQHRGGEVAGDFYDMVGMCALD